MFISYGCLCGRNQFLIKYTKMWITSGGLFELYDATFYFLTAVEYKVPLIHLQHANLMKSNFVQTITSKAK